jgi:hypothetical protein
MKGAYKKLRHEHSWVLGDTSIYLGFQILREKKNSWMPDLRLLIAETFPTGKYDHLDLRKNRSDALGSGSFITSAVFVLAKTFYTFPTHPYNLNLNVYYIYPSNASVRGVSIFGGTAETKGTAFPHTNFITNLGIEYSINRFWALGMDIRYVHQSKITFRAKEGSDKPGQPSSEQFSLAPCLEYSWSEGYSTAIGPWFTIAGRNSEVFFGVIGNVYCCF